MKFLVITAALMMSLSALACDGDKGKTDEEDKDQRITVIR
jgi:hypothetical protein